MSEFMVTAPLVIATDEDGARHHLYAGAPIPDSIGKDEVARLVEAGLVSSPKKATKATPKEGEAPQGNASREAWAEYATTKGASGEEVAEGGLTRDELRDKYGK